jgi:hypothetical protein
MAIANVTVTKTVAGESNQPHRQVLVSLDLDNSYPTGGYPIPLVGVANAEGYEIALVEAQPSGAYRFWWHPVDKKLMAFTIASDSASETGSGTNLSGITGLLLNCILR